jgi:hypothetical protein
VTAWTDLPLCAGVALALLGCSGPQVNITEVLNHGQCRKLDEGLQQISMAALPGIRGARLLQLETPPDPAAAPPRETDITLVAISKGTQPTAGYHFELLSAEADGLVVKLSYAWRTPEPGAMVAQVRTTPCSVVQLEVLDKPASQNKMEAVTAWVDGKAFGRIELQPD